MCRLTAYKGKSILIGSVVTKPNNSLLYQSRDAAYHPGVKDESHHRNILVNGDGFGVAWYSSEAVQSGACCFKFVTPAWSNQNLQNIGDHVTSNLIFAHIRAASSGHNPFEKITVNHENCHPFAYGKFTFMHNGGVPHFSKIKLALLNLLSAHFFQEIKGSTDSEHMFALFLTILFGKCPVSQHMQFNPSLEELINALNVTISTVLSLCSAAEVEEACSLNICLTDGVNVIATRFRNGPQSPPSLYYNYGSDFVCEDGNFYSKGKTADSVVISSAPLSRVGDGVDCDFSSEPSEDRPTSAAPAQFVLNEDDIGSWVLMPKDFMLICRGDPLNPYKVTSIDLKPVVVGPAFPGHSAALKKTATKQPQKPAGAEATANKSPLTKIGSFFAKKPRVMKFRSKL